MINSQLADLITVLKNTCTSTTNLFFNILVAVVRCILPIILCILFYFGHALSLWDLNSSTKDQIQALSVRVPSPDH